ncbi:hypothetical protein YP94_004663 [Salmonella enterica subsp. enterica]|nr:hypothetical protein [Salmonella enterica subsp. enterica]EBS4938019.1 hypothetical protein [Salmonella enterica subsp. enterica serovar Goverdhan]EBU7062693.1 hypothetical protein [Salmonella enterica subsp. enterica serovar Goverdhan]ECD2897417.1 hypothetical protein [Salmonella enterica subsp. enterica serovar Goverdhan]EDE8832291.1 hypothetical protein [Salmonella enterica subsp. enterica serovar Goverdhan]
MTGNKYGSAAAVRREVAEYLRPPRRMPVAEGIKQFMFVPRGTNTAVLAWRKYRLQVNRVDTLKPVWPEKPASSL